MIACHNLTFSYSPQKHFSFPDIVCNDREALLILGQSGKGKTTLLHLMALLLRPEGGQVFINNQDITPLSVAEAAAVRASQIGIVYQRPHFVSSLNVMDNVLLSSYLAQKPQDKVRAKQLAEQLGFADHLSKKTNQLSQGEQQRVSIARALMNNPAVILADEPTSSLDDINCDKVIELLKNQSEQIGASLVVVTHDQRLKDAFAKQVKL
ncbi:ATP-binding cassette domain-containing protein [Runella sp. CRIBMP]|jgi:lipoprotein-releasing system ATP-binding protein|uniref:ABC transporter ATP-binding protein n=1 Tax=Runella sp. CRIBMP TaxID=2683261 RepID=UPI00141330CC|nr:ATP-binding cassette domain-containing protein [Runella sp. CRIBMP]NBB21429.1 ATP-binding cassette domain-containing protein [Runella sp. CRIBMP]